MLRKAFFSGRKKTVDVILDDDAIQKLEKWRLRF